MPINGLENTALETIPGVDLSTIMTVLPLFLLSTIRIGSENTPEN